MDMLIVGLGLIMMFRCAYKFTGKWVLSSLPPLFFLMSPTFVDYTASFMLDPVAASISIMGLCLYLDHLHIHSYRKYIMSFVLLALASFIKLSTGICMIAVVAHEVLRYILPQYNKGIKFDLKVILLPFLAVIGLLYLNFRHINYLNETYNGHIFMSQPNFLTKGTWKELIENRFPNLWKYEYFIKYAYLLFGGILLLGTLASFQAKKYLSWILLIPILGIGVLCLFYLFGEQFIHHDYYIISIFFPFLSIVLITCVINMSECKLYNKSTWVTETLWGVILIALLFSAHQSVHARQQPEYKSFSDYYYYPWLMNGKHFLDKNGIAQREHIIVLEDPSPNLSLCYFDRKGYVYNTDYPNKIGQPPLDIKAIIQLMKDRQVKYAIVSQKNYQNSQYLDYKNIASVYFDIIDSTDTKVLMKLKND